MLLVQHINKERGREGCKGIQIKQRGRYKKKRMKRSGGDCRWEDVNIEKVKRDKRQGRKEDGENRKT